jgi:hypothetical protein
MAYIFQYGSNMSVSRLNHEDRLCGNAKVVCVAKTIEKHYTDIHGRPLGDKGF